MYNYNQIPKNQNNRIIGGFVGPFILGGITGGLISPLFYNNGYNRPTYYQTVYYPYPIYTSYYR